LTSELLFGDETGVCFLSVSYNANFMAQLPP